MIMKLEWSTNTVTESISGIQGVISEIDANGDAEGNYTLLARVPHKSLHANYSMLPVGHFLIGNDLPVSI
jgi:hypothetical protein